MCGWVGGWGYDVTADEIPARVTSAVGTSFHQPVFPCQWHKPVGS